MTEKENNMYQTILNLSQVIQDQQKECDLWKAIIKERDKTIAALHEERKDLQKALDEQIEVSANLREQLNDARKIIERIRQYAENHCKL